MSAARRSFRFDAPAEPDRWNGLPAALARLALALPPGTPVRCTVAADTYPGDAPAPADLVTGAGFTVEAARYLPFRASGPVGAPAAGGGGRFVVDARRDRTLPDFVAGGLRALVCGLNPSLVAADAGYGFAGATNRFWAVAAASGLVAVPRDPLASLAADRVGMTDLVKRATPNADTLTAEEYRAGAERVRRLVEWLRPGVVISVGLAGWRAAIDRRAVAGRQPA
ncbi:MAG TPA: mismatch-specific DNA-glycosylase, partial [Acidimicrobiia bacterium]|nr:mismatch-specific DNA-glycosylase [Acidimicrobiia bacterium]